MTAPHHTPLIAQEIAGAIDWWREAGVDLAFSNDANTWLADDAPPEPSRPAPEARVAVPAAAPVAERADPFAGDAPASLAEFREWWLGAPGLDHVGPHGRVPPRGEAGAALMIVVADPEPGDTSTLLSGEQGRLLDAMLAAMGIAREAAYFASVLPRPTPLADTATLEQTGAGAVLRHHVALVAPRRILAFGGNILPLLAHGTAQAGVQAPGVSAHFAHGDRRIDLLGAEGLDALLAMPRLKARLWRRWLEWTDGLSET